MYSFFFPSTRVGASLLPAFSTALRSIKKRLQPKALRGKEISIKNTSDTFDRQFFFLRVLRTQKAWEKHANNILLYLLFSSKTFSYWFSLTRPDSVSSYFRSEIQKCRFTTQAAFTGINLQSLHWFASIVDLSFMKLNLSIKSKVKPHSVLFSKLEKVFCSK